MLFEVTVVEDLPPDAVRPAPTGDLNLLTMACGECVEVLTVEKVCREQELEPEPEPEVEKALVVSSKCASFQHV